jgi:ATP-binding cassette subfamily F protein uup
MPLITLRNISLAFGGTPLLNGVDLTIEPGDRLCLLGRNGCGKSSMLKLLAGEQRPDGGDLIQPQGVRIAYVPQDTPPELSGPVFDVVCDMTLPPGRPGDRWRITVNNSYWRRPKAPG